jgi:dienelactone hydrolase
MLTYRNGSNAVIVVLHEIYGINQHMTNVCERLAETGNDIICPNLLSRDEPYSYDQEKIAYENFMTIGFKQAADSVSSTLRELRSAYKTVYVVGYSVGATIAWLCAAERGLVDAIVAYYGSRIRDYLDKQPQCPSLLLFPMQESSFDVDEVIRKLRGKDRVDVRKYEGLHGFTDPQNNNYSELAHKQTTDDTIRFLSHVSQSL